MLKGRKITEWQTFRGKRNRTYKQNNMPKVDNYIKFLKAFYAWEQQNNLTAIQERMLMRILRRANDSGWSEWIKISGFELMNELGISCKNTFVNNRNRLIELGIIEYRAGKKGKRSSYKLNMPVKKQLICSFKKQDETEEAEKKGRINIPNDSEKGMVNIPNNEKGMIDIPNAIPNSIPYSIPNNPRSPHEQCVPETPKHINYKQKNILNNKLFNIQKNKSQNGPDVLSDSPNKPDALSSDQKYDDVLSLYNAACSELPRASRLSAKCKRQIDKLLSLGYSLEDFKKAFENTQKSSFLCGKSGNRGWRANFAWLMKEDNFLKVLEGNYQDLDQSSKPSYDISEYENYSVFEEPDWEERFICCTKNG